MALVSFTLRSQDLTDKGSYARRLLPVVSKDNSNLRSDGYALPPAGPPQSTLEVTESGYGSLTVNWNVVSPYASSGAAANATYVSLVYSPWGEPQTILEGELVEEIPTDVDNEASPSFNVSVLSGKRWDVPQGKWAYFSLFIQYSSSSYTYYERVASVKILATEYLGSTYALWDRIPEYYREQDSNLGEFLDPTNPENVYKYGYLSPTNKVGTLFRFISIFGFEMDRVRTELNYMMVSRDPAIADTQVLSLLADEMGSEFRADDLGPQRLRPLLDNLPYLRRRKGTLSAVRDYIKVIGNCDADIDTSAKTIDFYAQRVNYLLNPDEPDDGLHRGALTSELTTPYPVDSTAETWPTAYTVSVSAPYTFTPTGAGCPIIIRLPQRIPVRQGDLVAFSVQYPGAGQEAIKWIRLLDSSNNEIGFSSTINRADTYPVLQVVATDNVTTTAYTAAYVEIYVDLTEISSFTLRNCLLERNNVGSYFDGYTIRGGWIVDGASASSDFQWTNPADPSEVNPNPATSLATYINQRLRTQASLEKIVSEVLPIDESSYTLTFGNIPGASVLP